MPLLDHFRPPANILARETLHSSWATRIADSLNAHWLPGSFVAYEHTHVGPHVEIDVATFERPKVGVAPSGNGGAVAALPRTWTVPAAACTVPLLFPDRFEVRVYADKHGLELVGAIELISPGNKDRPEERQAFAIKCATYLHNGVSVVLIDVVTTLHANLHNEIMVLTDVADAGAFANPDGPLYAAAYRPTLRDGRPECQLWYSSCALDQPLPTMPLRLTGDLFVPIDFEATYMETCRLRRLIP
jgi:hypothetical protein